MHLLLFQLLAIISSREISADPFPDSLSSPTIPEAHQHPAHAWDTGPGWDNGNENSYNQNNLIPTPTIPDELLFDPGYDTNNFLARAPADPTAFHNFKSFICAGSDSVCCLGNPLASARDAEACTEKEYVQGAGEEWLSPIDSRRGNYCSNSTSHESYPSAD